MPSDGYFVRYLEILSNSTPSPVTVDLRVSSTLQPFGGVVPGVIETSSGDASLQAGADRWVIVDDTVDGDPFLASSFAAKAYAFDGAGALDHADVAALNSGAAADVRYGWNGVVVPAGGTVVYMHFGATQITRSAAAASAARLVQLPPESLFGLSADELTWIKNFAIPPGSVSVLAPLPSIRGSVVGTVFEANATTPVPGAQVLFKSDSPFFGRTYSGTADGNGQFAFASRISDGDTLAIPVDAFTLRAVHPSSGVESPQTAGSFAEFESTATANVVFTNAGSVQGVVQRNGGEPVNTGSVRLARVTPSFSASVPIAANGSFLFTGVPTGTFDLTATVPHPQGTPLSASTVVQVAAGVTTTANLTLAATGNLAGTVRTSAGAAVAGAAVSLSGPAGNFSTSTSSSGQYLFSEIPAGCTTCTRSKRRLACRQTRRLRCSRA